MQTLHFRTLSSYHRPRPPPTSPIIPDLRFQRRRQVGVARSGVDDPGNGIGRDSIAGIVGEQVDYLLMREENRPLLDGLEAASRRVELARQALSDIKKQEDEASRAKGLIRQLQYQEAQIAESQKELLEARALVDEAERFLSSSIDRKSPDDYLEGKSEIDTDAERLESLRAAVVSTMAGTLAALPISFYQATSNDQLIQSLAVVSISCFLFGATFRYAIRRDLDNVHLKTGTCAAFGLVKGLTAIEANPPDFSNIDQVLGRGIYLSESVIIFIFSAIALDFSFKTGFLSPFPIINKIDRPPRFLSFKVQIVYKKLSENKVSIFSSPCHIVFCPSYIHLIPHTTLTLGF